MITMDLKGITWIGDMYNKFENMCVEVEETMYQDTVKYVESQMQTVGASVKKFYSDVMQDLIPPSSLDPIKEENPSIDAANHVDFSVSKKALVEDTDSMNPKADQMVKDFQSIPKVDHNENSSSCSAVCSVITPFVPTLHISVGEQCVNENLESQISEKDLSNDSNPQSYVVKDLDDEQHSELKSGSGMSSRNANMTEESGDESTCEEVSSEIDEPLCEPQPVGSNLISMPEVDQRKEDGAGISGEMTEGKENVEENQWQQEESRVDISDNRNALANFGEPSNPSIASEIENGVADNQPVLATRQFDKMKLGESCILVESSEHSFKLPLANERKSYKKKIKEVFNPKKWSKSKQDQEQLAIWYEEQTGNSSLPTLLNHAGISDAQELGSLESEWELL